jgi:hypothetical protein
MDSAVSEDIHRDSTDRFVLSLMTDLISQGGFSVVSWLHVSRNLVIEFEGLSAFKV